LNDSNIQRFFNKKMALFIKLIILGFLLKKCVKSATISSSTTQYRCDVLDGTSKKRFSKAFLCIHFLPFEIKMGITVVIDKPQIIRIEDAYAN